MRSTFPPFPRRFWHRLASLGLCATLSVGCTNGERPVHYFGDRHLDYYKQQATEIAYPLIDEPTPESVSMSQQPRNIRDRLKAEEAWDMTLQEALHLSLSNNKIVRRNDRNTLQGNGSRVLAAPDGMTSIWDPAIQETGVLFGGRGVEAALAAFDTQFTTRMLWGRSENIQNNVFTGGGLDGGSTLVNETGSWIAQLQKQFATGGSVGLSHNWDYSANNIPTALFPSSYTGSVRADFRQPLWQGAGVEFTRIAGPVSQNIQGLSGVNQGVLISRINNDISIADFESAVTDMQFDVEKAYWDLYFAYRRYDTAVINRNSALRTWREVKAKFDLGAQGGGAADEAQAREAYFERRATEEASLANIDTLELALRRLCGLPVNDGRIIRPVDEPITAEFLPDWYGSLAEALTRRVELRRQKWQIKSLDLQLTAARSLTHPRFDFVSSYAVNGFGDHLIRHHDDSFTTNPQTGNRFNPNLNSAYEVLTQGNQTSWTTGFEFSMPLGFRTAHAQVRNLELRMAKARELLQVQEEEIAYELATTIQDLHTNWINAQTNFNRRLAAERQVQAFEAEYQNGTKTLDLLLQAQARLANAENAYYNSIVEYTKTIAHINYRKGTLLDVNGVQLAEGQWRPEAYQQALGRAWARSDARDAKGLRHEPPAFASPSYVGTTEIAVEAPAVESPQASPVPAPTEAGTGVPVPMPAPEPAEPPVAPAVPPPAAEPKTP